MQGQGATVVSVERFGNTYFLTQIKSSLYPAGVLCFFFSPAAVSATTWPSRFPLPQFPLASMSYPPWPSLD